MREGHGYKMNRWKRFYGLLEGYRLTYVFLYLTKLSYMALKMLMPLVLAAFVDEVLYHHNREAVGIDKFPVKFVLKEGKISEYGNQNCSTEP